LKEQLHKIASSRTGGAKTDEALGKTGAGPEGLPHSIIVTMEGIEGETDAAQQQADASPSVSAPDIERPSSAQASLKIKRRRSKAESKAPKSIKATKTAVGQQNLFVESAASLQKVTSLKPKRSATTRGRRGK
jgi:DNA topoisomerase-6 subunit B